MSKKRRSKWDQGAPEPAQVVPPVVQPSPLLPKSSAPEGSSSEPSVSAAVAAAKLNAMLEAKGKLLKPAGPAIPSPSNTTSTSDHTQPMVSAEIEINDSEARSNLTKGPVLSEINRSTGALVSVRGRYMSPEERLSGSFSNPENKPLYLLIQASTQRSIDAAIVKIREQMQGPRHYLPPAPLLPSGMRPQLPPGQLQQQQLPGGHHYVQDKVFVSINDAPDSFGLLDKLQGPGGSFLGHIAATTGAKVFLRGKGSGYIEPTSGRESFEALYIYISHPASEGLMAARKLCESLIDHVMQEYQTFVRNQLSYGYSTAPYHQAVPPPAPQYTTFYQNPYGPVPPGPVPLPMAALPPPGGGGPYPYPPPSGHVPYLPPLPGGAAVHQGPHPLLQAHPPEAALPPPPPPPPHQLNGVPPYGPQPVYGQQPSYRPPGMDVYPPPPPPPLVQEPSNGGVGPQPLISPAEQRQTFDQMVYHQLPRDDTGGVELPKRRFIEQTTNDDSTATDKERAEETEGNPAPEQAPAPPVTAADAVLMPPPSLISLPPRGLKRSSEPQEKPTPFHDSHQSSPPPPPPAPPAAPPTEQPKRMKLSSLVAYGDDSSDSDNEH